jgi:hypothetical protein
VAMALWRQGSSAMTEIPLQLMDVRILYVASIFVVTVLLNSQTTMLMGNRISRVISGPALHAN